MSLHQTIPIFIHDTEISKKSDITTSLILEDFHFSDIKAKGDIIGKLTSYDESLLFITVPEGSASQKELIAKIISDKRLEKVYVIALISNENTLFINDLKKLGVYGVLPKSLNQEMMQKHLSKMLGSIKNLGERRKTIRIKPNEKDIISVTVLHPARPSTISGHVKIISMDGLMLELKSEKEAEGLQENMELKSLTLWLQGTSIDMSGLLTAVYKKMIGVKFSKLKPFEARLISKYINERNNIEYVKRKGPASKKEEKPTEKEIKVEVVPLDQKGGTREEDLKDNEKLPEV